MDNNWQTKKLGEVCDIINGSTPLRSKKEFWDNGDIPWFTIDDIREQGRIIQHTKQKITQLALGKMSSRLLPPRSILLCCTASVGEYAMTTLSLTTNQQFNGLIIKDKALIIPDYLFYFSSTLKDKLLGMSGKSTIDFIPISRLKNIEINFPLLADQRRIVKILDEAFTAIAKAKDNTEKNLQNSHELFETYLKNIFANPGKDWEEKRINEVCELKSGTTISPSLERKDGDVLYTKIADMNLPENIIEIRTSSRLVNSSEIKKSQIIPVGAIIFPKRGGAIATNKKRKIVKPTIVDLNTMAIIPSNKIDNEYFYHWFRLINLSNISNGTSIPQINNYSFDEIYITYPTSLKEQKIIVAKLDALAGETKKLEEIFKQKLVLLEELKKSLLHQAFSGEL